MQPLVSVIIPVGPAHTDLVRQAVASVRWQTVAPWCEVVIINDSGAALRVEADQHLTGERRGPAAARNIGIQSARGVFCLFLDADDYLLPGGIEALLRGYAASDAAYVYGDVYTSRGADSPALGRSPDYDQATLASYNLHVVTALVPTSVARLVGGFDADVDGHEDWTLYLRLAIAGQCGVRHPDVALVYRTDTGDRRERHATDARSLMDVVIERHQNQEGKIVMGGCCGGVPEARMAAASVLRELPVPDDALLSAGGSVRVEYTGESRGSVTYRHPVSGRSYRVGNNAIDRYAQVQADDLEWLQQVAEVQVVRPIAPYVPPPVLVPEPLATDERTFDPETEDGPLPEIAVDPEADTVPLPVVPAPAPAPRRRNQGTAAV